MARLNLHCRALIADGAEADRHGCKSAQRQQREQHEDDQKFKAFTHYGAGC